MISTFKKTKLAIALIGLMAAAPAFAKTPHADVYQTDGSCDGLPRLQVDTPAGFCVGLVSEGFKFTRGIAPLANGDLVVVDMGGWVEKKGVVWLLTKKDKGYVRTRLLSNIDRPNGVTVGPDKKIYVGAIDRIFRFDLANPSASIEDVVGGKSGVADLPTSGLHPLTSMIFDQDNNLFVNVGSETNICAKADTTKVCPETTGDNPRGTLRKYTMHDGKVKSAEVYANGLRNSMALAIHPSTGELWQGENSRDNINALNPKLKDVEFPHDEINLIKKGEAYGWPYCYDNNQNAPEYPRWDCSAYTAPQVLLPAHAAPLGMFFYTGKLLPSKFQNNLIVGFHGYRDTGHRLMAYPFNASGKPDGAPTELISGWGKAGAPLGAPVDVKMAEDGSIYITEDRNGTVLRLTYTAKTSNVK